MRINLDEAIKYISQGDVIGVPTETVYGLAASIDNPTAIEKIYTLKNRPRINPLIIHADQQKNITPFIQTFPPHYEALAEVFWPGPMTLILPVKTHLIPPIVRADLNTAGFRIPNHPLTLELLKETGPLVMPSANLSGRPSSTEPMHIEEDFGSQFPVLDGGLCEKGLESTILFFHTTDKWVILRLGSISPEEFIPVLGYSPQIMNLSSNQKPLSPGQTFRHYAPKAKLFFGEEGLYDASFVLGFRERHYPKNKRIICLGSLKDPKEIAENLYKALRQVDQEGAQKVWVDMDFPSNGLWRTIAERLQRASEH